MRWRRSGILIPIHRPLRAACLKGNALEQRLAQLLDLPVRHSRSVAFEIRRTPGLVPFAHSFQGIAARSASEQHSVIERALGRPVSVGNNLLVTEG